MLKSQLFFLFFSEKSFVKMLYMWGIIIFLYTKLTVFYDLVKQGFSF
ncbi:hypothetical protein FlaCF_4304 [Flavobacterium tructae]